MRDLWRPADEEMIRQFVRFTSFAGLQNESFLFILLAALGTGLIEGFYSNIPTNVDVSFFSIRRYF